MKFHSNYKSIIVASKAKMVMGRETPIVAVLAFLVVKI